MGDPVVHGPYQFFFTQPDNRQNKHFSKKAFQNKEQAAVVQVFKLVEMHQLYRSEMLQTSKQPIQGMYLITMCFERMYHNFYILVFLVYRRIKNNMHELNCLCPNASSSCPWQLPIIFLLW